MAAMGTTAASTTRVRKPFCAAQGTDLLRVRMAAEHRLETFHADQVCAAADADDADADVLFDAFETDWALGVGRRGGVGVGEEVGVFGHEGVGPRGA